MADEIKMPDFSNVGPGDLRRWRRALNRPDIQKQLKEVARLAKILDATKAKLFRLGKWFDEVAEDLTGYTRPYESILPSHVTEAGYGHHWYEMPRDGKARTAHEAFARFCATVYAGCKIRDQSV